VRERVQPVYGVLGHFDDNSRRHLVERYIVYCRLRACVLSASE
jgi:hypothetical protein